MKEILFNYFPELSHVQVEHFLKLEELYSEWNKKINVISRKDIGNFNIHHLLHSISIAKVTRFAAGTEIIDVGTGGGFPGLPLAIFFPEVSFTLVDSIRKKTVVAQSVADTLNLQNIKVICSRAEDIQTRYDFVVSRAVTAFPIFVSWTNKLVKKRQKNQFKNGILYLKGGDLAEELGKYRANAEIYNLSNHFSESFFEEKKLVYLPI